MSEYRYVQRSLDDYDCTLAELRAFVSTQLERGQRSQVLTDSMRTYLKLRHDDYLADPGRKDDPLPHPLVLGNLVDELIFVYPDELCDALADAKARDAARDEE